MEFNTVKVESTLLLLGAESIIKLVQICNNGTSKAQRLGKINGGHSGFVEICTLCAKVLQAHNKNVFSNLIKPNIAI